MTAAPKLVDQGLYVHGLFCEDVRDEVNGMHSYTGVLPDQMLIPAFPAGLVRVALVTWLSVPLESTLPGTVRLALALPDGTEMAAEPAPFQPAVALLPQARRQVVVGMWKLQLVPLEQEGWLRGFVDVDGARYLAASLYVAPPPGRMTPPPAA